MMISKKTISCIIPAWNRKELLKITLNSIIKQTISPLEILIINNGNKIIDYDYLDIKNPDKFNIKI